MCACVRECLHLWLSLANRCNNLTNAIIIGACVSPTELKCRRQRLVQQMTKCNHLNVIGAARGWGWNEAIHGTHSTTIPACAAVAAPPAAAGIRRECWNEHENGCWCAGLRLAISRCTRCRRTTPARQKHCTSALLTAHVLPDVDLDGIAEYRYGFHVALFTNF
jgi:hypothetical protein